MPQHRLRDIRQEGFADRVPVEEAIQWIDRHSPCDSTLGDSEPLLLEDAVGRILAQPFVALADKPPVDTAVENGYALRSAETVGAGSYNPLPFHIQIGNQALGLLSTALISSGTPLPPGADAVAPFDLVRVASDIAELIGSVAQGTGVNLQGHEIRNASTLVEPSRPLRPSDLGLIAGFGISQVRVLPRPLVRIILAGCKPSQANSPDANGPDSNGLMLRALVARDGGVIELCEYGIADRDALAGLIARPGADVVLVCGRSGTGPDDVAPLALADAGTLSIHGIALRPAASTGMGAAGDVPVILLPGNPLACLCAYDLFAGRLIRRLGGRSPHLPYLVRRAIVGRKIVSSIGDLELCRVRWIAAKAAAKVSGEAAGEAIPLNSADSGGLASVARADGFILVPAALEGYAPGTSIDVYLYDGAESVEA
jgi:molybdopterin molybdotransferase